MLQQQDLHETRERASKHQKEGSDAKERLSEHARLSSGNHIKAGTNRVGECACELIIERRIEKEHQLQEKLDKSRADWEKILNDANEFLQQQKEKRLWTAKDYQIVLKHLRQSKDEKIKKKNDLVLLHEPWKERVPLTANEIGLSTDENNNEEEVFDIGIAHTEDDVDPDVAV